MTLTWLRTVCSAVNRRFSPSFKGAPLYPKLAD